MNPTRILTLRANLIRLNPLLDSEGPTRFGSDWVQIGLIKYSWTRIWTLFEFNPSQLKPFWDPEGQPNLLGSKDPKIGPKIRLN